MTTERRQQHEEEGLWDVTDVAAFLKCSVAKVRADVFNEKVPVVRVGRLVRFRPSEIREWLESQQKAAGSEPPVDPDQITLQLAEPLKRGRRSRLSEHATSGAV